MPRRFSIRINRCGVPLGRFPCWKGQNQLFNSLTFGQGGWEIVLHFASGFDLATKLSSTGVSGNIFPTAIRSRHFLRIM
jgi:hypothetical protein